MTVVACAEVALAFETGGVSPVDLGEVEERRPRIVRGVEQR